MDLPLLFCLENKDVCQQLSIFCSNNKDLREFSISDHQIEHFAFSQSVVFGNHKVANNFASEKILRRIMVLQTSEPKTKHKSTFKKFSTSKLQEQ